MHQTPYSKRRGWPKTKAPFTPRKKGLFEDGQWLCTLLHSAYCPYTFYLPPSTFPLLANRCPSIQASVANLPYALP